VSAAQPMRPSVRLAIYRRQNGQPAGPANLTPRQRRRYDRKQALWLREAREWYAEVTG
jgi:hypothetical protein